MRWLTVKSNDWRDEHPRGPEIRPKYHCLGFTTMCVGLWSYNEGCTLQFFVLVESGRWHSISMDVIGEVGFACLQAAPQVGLCLARNPSTTLQPLHTL